MHHCIRKIRLSKRIKQKELARRIGKSAATLSKYEQDQMEVSLSMLARIAEALNVPITRLLVVKRQRQRPPVATVG